MRPLALAYDDVGAGPPPLLLVAAPGAGRSTLTPMVALLRGRHRVVTVDGFDTSDGTDSNVVAGRRADDLALLSVHLGLHRPLIVVHGEDPTGQAVAARNPDLPSGLVIIPGRPCTRLISDATFPVLHIEPTPGTSGSADQPMPPDHTAAAITRFLTALQEARQPCDATTGPSPLRSASPPASRPDPTPDKTLAPP